MRCSPCGRTGNQHGRLSPSMTAIIRRKSLATFRNEPMLSVAITSTATLPAAPECSSCAAAMASEITTLTNVIAARRAVLHTIAHLRLRSAPVSPGRAHAASMRKRNSSSISGEVSGDRVSAPRWSTRPVHPHRPGNAVVVFHLARMRTAANVPANAVAGYATAFDFLCQLEVR